MNYVHALIKPMMYLIQTTQHYAWYLQQTDVVTDK
jgi:hypothetical protein